MPIIHYFIVASLIGCSYFCIKHSMEEEPGTSFEKWTQSSFLHKLSKGSIRVLENSYLDRSFREAGLPPYISSVRYNFFRHLALLSILILKWLDGFFSFQVVSSLFVFLIFVLYLLSLPILRESSPFQYVLKFLQRQHIAKKNEEVYSLFHLMKAEFHLEDQYMLNMYHLLKKNRRYFHHIRPSIDRCLHYWQDGVDVAWEHFATHIGTHEARALADIMQEVDQSGYEEARHLLEQKRQEFANANYNAFKDYLDRRRLIMFVVVMICSLSTLVFFAVPHIMEYRAIMDELNQLQQR